MTKIENMKNTAHMLEKRSAMMLEQARMEGEVPADVEKFLDLLHDEAFRTDFMNCASAEAVKELLDRNGIPFTMEDIDAMLMAISATLQKLDENNGELTEEDLEQIAGGWSWGCFFKNVGLGLLAGVIIVAVVAAGVAAITASGGAALPVAGATVAKVVGGIIGLSTAIGGVEGVVQQL